MSVSRTASASYDAAARTRPRHRRGTYLSADPRRDYNGWRIDETQASYLGERYLRLAFGKYYEGAISIEQLADYLNVKVSSVGGLEQAALQAP
jgi:hypothetical protein